MTARYLRLSAGELGRRARRARELSSACGLCPRECRANRPAGEAGECGLAEQPRISSANLHHGEEPPISGTRGSGTIFFSGCNLACVFCQNYPISQLRHGRDVSTAELAQAMLSLQGRGAHNINLVTPSHAVWPILEALALAADGGLHLPLVYNCSGYDSVLALELLDGIVDVYMPDLKYGSDEVAVRLSGISDYWQTATAALREMQRQVGELRLDDDGVALSGLLVRHLVLPQELSGSERVLHFIASELGKSTAVSLMRQYFPANKAPRLPPLDRPLLPAEFEAALEILERHKLDSGWIQE